MVVKSATKKKLMDWGIPEGMAHYMADDMKYGAIESMTWDEFYEKYSDQYIGKRRRYFRDNPYYLEFAFAIIHDLPIEPPQPTSIGLINWVFLFPDYTDDQYDEAYKEFDFTAKAKGDKRYQYDDYRKWWKEQDKDKRKEGYPSPYDTQKSRHQYDYHLRDQYLQSYAQK
jgi:hypothetical protein